MAAKVTSYNLLMYNRWLWFSVVLNMSCCLKDGNCLLCEADEYYDVNTQICSSCHDLCRVRPDHSTDASCRQHCLRYSKGETTNGSHAGSSVTDPSPQVHGEDNALWKKPLFWTSVISVSISVLASIVLIVLCTCKKARTMASHPNRSRTAQLIRTQPTQHPSKDDKEYAKGKLLNETEQGEFRLESCDGCAVKELRTVRAALCDPREVSGPANTDAYVTDRVTYSRQSSMYLKPPRHVYLRSQSSSSTSTDSGFEENPAKQVTDEEKEDLIASSPRPACRDTSCKEVFDVGTHLEDDPDELEETKALTIDGGVEWSGVCRYSAVFEEEEENNGVRSLPEEAEERQFFDLKTETGKRIDQDGGFLFNGDPDELEYTQLKLPVDGSTRSANGCLSTVDNRRPVDGRNKRTLHSRELLCKNAVASTDEDAQGSERKGEVFRDVSRHSRKSFRAGDTLDADQRNRRTYELSVIVSCIDTSNYKQPESNFIDGIGLSCELEGQEMKLKDIFHIEIREV